MKVAFVYRGFESIAVELLSACLKKSGHDVELFYEPALFATFHVSYKWLHNLFDSTPGLVENISAACAGLICFSVVSDDYGWAFNVARAIKQRNKNLKIIFGGIHPTSVPELVLQESCIDYVCVGEGEEALPELAAALQAGRDTTSICNIWTKKNGRIIRSPLRPLIKNLDLLPFPDKELFYEVCRGFTNRIYMTMSSRGCPYACSYCYGSYLKELYKNKGVFLRRRSIYNMIRELEAAKYKFSFKKILFVDDVFVCDFRWLSDFLVEYKKRINLPFGCLMYPRWDKESEKIIKMLEWAGCVTIGMGIQSVAERQRKNVLCRPGTNQEIVDNIKIFAKSRIFVYADFILGAPGQDASELMKTAEFVSKYKPDAAATMWLRYYPKTGLLERAKREHWISAEEAVNNEQSKEYHPIAKQGGTFDKSLGKLGNLVLIAHVLPGAILRLILNSGVYRYFPARNLQYATTFLMIVFKRIFQGKDGALYFCTFGLVEYYFFSIKRKLEKHKRRIGGKIS